MNNTHALSLSLRLIVVKFGILTGKIILKMVHWEDPGDEMEREEGGGIGKGNTCKSMADSCQCMAKTTTIL